MIETYYVRRSESGKETHNLDKLIVRMSTPDRVEALCNAAESAIINPGRYYYTYKGNTQIAKFYVEEEN